MPYALANRRVEVGRLEIRALPALLSPGADHLERAILSSEALDHLNAPDRCDAVPLRGLPLQLRKFPAVQGKVFLAPASGAKGGNARPRITTADFGNRD
jgi:hypothetical protein